MKAGLATLAGLLLWSCVILPTPARAADVPGSDLQISVLTFGPGEIYWERFGHNAILVRDTSTGSAIAYNYGIFDFNQKNFFLNFARGYMIYRIAADSLSSDLAMYREAGRSVTEQVLNLTPAQRLNLRQFLRWNARPENARYRYDYFVSNCSTRVRDALNSALDGSLQKQLQPRMAPLGHSYRFEAVRLISPDLLLGLAMDIALGPAADRPLTIWQESFVPMVLSQALNTIHTDDSQGKAEPLVSSETTLLAGRLLAEPKQPPQLLGLFLIIGLGFAVLLLMLGASSHKATRLAFTLLATAYTLFCGTGGLILAALWGLTQHWGGWYNENLLLLNPLILLLIPSLIAHVRRRPVSGVVRGLAALIALLATGSLLVRLLPGCYQDNLHWIALFLPIHLALMLNLFRQRARALG